jgi:crotonobetainyl-CoA:carnitine CoA-transferase CaiB-like acyl-CoA transferase
VIDLTTVLMGPSAAQTLGDYGADVIKVESPDGDMVRDILPTRRPRMGAMFMNANRSKRGIVLDLKRPDGRDALLRLAAGADVLVYNVRPRAMARLGLGYETLREVNPRLVYAGLFGFGQDGPYAARPAYDDLIQGAAGLAWLMTRSGSPEPRYVPTAIADRLVGQVAVGAILAALLERTRSGFGQRVDVPMFETMAAIVLADHLGGLAYEPPLDAGGYARQLSPDRKPYATRDGHVCALVYNDAQWQRFARAIGRPELLDDPRFATYAGRSANVAAVNAELVTIFAQRTTAQWNALLEAADIPSLPMHDLQGLLADPQLAASGMLPLREHPTEGLVRTIAPPVKLHRTPAEPERLAPRQGEHTVEVLREAGLDDARIDAMLRDGTAVQAPPADHPPTAGPR